VPSFLDAMGPPPGPVGLPQMADGPSFVPPTTEPAVPAPMAPRPAVPAFGMNQPPMVSPQQQGPAFASAKPMTKVAMIAALLGGIKDPLILSSAVAGLQKARDRKQAMLETQQQTADRRMKEQADFYARAMQNAAQFDDPVAFEEWRASIGPMAQLYGVNPAVFTFSDQKRADKDRKLMADAIDVAVRRHGPEILNRDDVTLQLSDGRQVSMKTARQAAGGGVFEQGAGDAGMVPVKVPPPKPAEDPNAVPNTDYSRFLARYAQSKGKTIADLTAAEELEARGQFGRSDDRVVVTGATPPRRQDTRVDAKARAFDNQQGVKNAAVMSEAANFVSSLDPNTKNPGDDQALIYAFAKVMDPNSVVREGEYATVQRYAQSWGETFGFNAARIFSNTPFLSTQARANMKATILNRFNAARDQYLNLRRSYAQQINAITGAADGEDYLTDHAGAFPKDTRTPAATPAGTSIQVGRFTVTESR
jgi:hypothetical protein